MRLIREKSQFWIVAILLHLLVLGATGSEECECGVFIQPWPTSHMIRVLPDEFEKLPSDCAANKTEICRDYCANQLDLHNETLWTLVLKKSCLAVYDDVHKTVPALENSYLRGSVQGFYRSCDHIWTPMGPDFRRRFSCRKHLISKRSTTGPGTSEAKNLNLEPELEPEEDLADSERAFSDLLKVGSMPEIFQKYSRKYAQELDMLRCFSEYLMYSVFNHRYQNSPRADNDLLTGLGFEIFNYLKHNKGAVKFLNDILIQQVSKPDQKITETAENLPVTSLQYLIKQATDIISSNFVSNAIDEPLEKAEDPNEMAEMIEEATKPFVLSLLGVVPGVPASGRAKKPNSITQKNGIELRESVDKQGPPKTGNPFYDIGNRFAYSFQSATDSTSGFYCMKQYFVNKVWKQYRGRVRSILKYFPNSA